MLPYRVISYQLSLSSRRHSTRSIQQPQWISYQKAQKQHIFRKVFDKEIQFHHNSSRPHQNMSSEDKSLCVNGEYLNNLCFTKNIDLIANNSEELQSQISDRNQSCKSTGLNMNLSKAKVMFNEFSTCQHLRFLVSRSLNRRNKLAGELLGRITISWSKMPLYLKSKAVDQCILPIITHDCKILNAFIIEKCRVC